MGALNYAEVVEGGQGWRLIACIWLHAGVVHLLANMLSLLFIGVRLEQEFGFGKPEIEENICYALVFAFSCRAVLPQIKDGSGSLLVFY